MMRQPRTHLRSAYESLNFLYYVMENYVTEDNRKNFYHDTIAKAKRDIRKTYNRMENPNKYFVKDYGMDGWIEKEIFTNTTAEKVIAYAENNWIECMPSMYDCTGQIFTSWFKVFEVEDKVILYTEYSRDV